MRGLAALPLGFHYACSGFMAWLLGDVIRYRRDVVMTNLSRSFPGMKYKELKSVAKKFYAHLGEIFAEAIWFGGCRNPERLRKKELATVVNPEELYEAYRNRPSVMVMDSHAGNWELLGGFCVYDHAFEENRPYGVNDVVVVYKPLNNKTWDEIMRVNRCAPVLRDDFKGCVSSGEVLRHALSRRDEKKVYVFPNDQYPYKMAKVKDPVRFMNQDTKAMEAGAALAHKMGMAVFYMNMRPVSKGHYEIRYTKICDDASMMAPHDINQEFYRLLERDLGETPWNYLWSHKRWK